MEYWVVTMKDGTIRDFNKSCNYVVEFPNRINMICFKYEIAPKHYKTLSMINVDCIQSIDLFVE